MNTRPRNLLISFTLLHLAALGQTVSVLPADRVEFPGIVDSNSPAYWHDGVRYLYNSVQGPIRVEANLNNGFQRARSVLIVGEHKFRWIESVWRDADGTIFAWYHSEQFVECNGTTVAMPEIGALISADGANFYDLGIVLRSGASPDCRIGNRYFAGGHGDFSVIPDRNGEYFYFFYTNYGGPLEQQGIAVARMAVANRKEPVGAVWKFRQGNWSEPGLGGVVEPIFPALAEWNGPEPRAYWGPSIHWNTAINRYVMLLNEAIDFEWTTGPLEIAFAEDLANPASWTEPVVLMDVAPGWYPQILGTGPEETDSLSGPEARLYVGGYSEWILYFENGPLRVVPSAQTRAVKRLNRNVTRRPGIAKSSPSRK